MTFSSRAETWAFGFHLWYMRYDQARQLIDAIMDYVEHHNENPTAFIWTAKIENILAKVARARAVLNNVQSN